MTKKEAKKIGELFNNILVAKIMANSNRQKGDIDGVMYWQKDEALNTIELHEMGIPMAGYEPSLVIIKTFKEVNGDD
jgi:hypothetical protein